MEFLRVLTDELRPWVDERFHTSDERGLAGYSRGGNFAIYALLANPGSFSHYLIASPALWWDNQTIQAVWEDTPVMFDFEARYAETHQDLEARVFLAVAKDEELNMPLTSTFHSFLLSRGYPSLEIDYQVFVDETHLSVIPAIVSRGLR